MLVTVCSSKPACNVTNSRDSWKNDCVDFHLFVLGSIGWVQLIVHCDVCKYRSSPLAWLDQLVWGDQLPHVMSADLLTIQQWNQTGTASTDTNPMISSACILCVLRSQTTLHCLVFNLNLRIYINNFFTFRLLGINNTCRVWL